MRRFKAILGYTTAGLVLLIMILTPFALMPGITRLVGGLGIRPHPKYSGGPVVRTLDRGSYQVAISAPARALGVLEQVPPFIQVSWSPLSALPNQVEEQLDLDGDGRAEVSISFAVPKDATIPLKGQVKVLDPAKVLPLTEVGRDGFYALLVRLEGRIVARFPLR